MQLESKTVVTCPRCHNGYNFPLFCANPELVESNPEFFKCDICNGTGRLSLVELMNMQTCSRYHTFRVEQLKLTLRQFCAIHNVNIQMLSSFERGKWDAEMMDRLDKIICDYPGGRDVTSGI